MYLDFEEEINKDILKRPIQLCEGMINLSKIWIKIASYPSVQVLLKFNENSKLFLASYLYRFIENDVTEKLLITVLESMLRLFTILEVVDTGFSSSNFKSFLFSENLKFVNLSISNDEIEHDFITHIKMKCDIDLIKNAIKDYDKHMLVYLNEYLFAKENGEVFSIEAKHDIEHIMPYSGINNNEIRIDACINSKDEFISIVNKLGNKILLEEKINRTIGNEWFRSKISTKLENKTGYIDSKYPIAKMLVHSYKDCRKPYWTKDDIIKATDMAAERIVKFIFDEI